MEIVRDPSAMQELALSLRREGKRLAFVPTMGYLHDGHLSLLREGRRRGDVLVLSIFVNPTQFGPAEDLDRYPRDFARDCDLAREAGVDLIFAPEREALYPEGFATWVTVEGLTETLCGRSRPGHFRGVTTVVAKLFALVQPHVALFGRKDFQQLAVIRRMARDLDLPVEVVGLPIVREADGLAMSSRNVYLEPDERSQALALIDVLRAAATVVRAGERRASPLLDQARRRLQREPKIEIDYVQICDADTLADVDVITDTSVLLLAVRVGRTRLIDNHILCEEV